MSFLILVISTIGVFAVYLRAQFVAPVIKHIAGFLLLSLLISFIEKGLVHYKVKAVGYTIISKEVLLFILTGVLFFSITSYGSKKE
jgi:hypothetical protein